MNANTAAVPIVGLPSFMVNNLLAGKAVPQRTEKWWGYELTYINAPNAKANYCSKMLYFNDQGHTSMHFHVDKHETLVVVSGKLTLDIIVNKETKRILLEAGEAWVMPPGLPHRLSALDGPLTIMESSTKDSFFDSMRIA